MHILGSTIRPITWRRVEARVMKAEHLPPVRQMLGGTLILFPDGPSVYVASTDRVAFGHHLKSRELKTAEVVSSWLAWVHQRAAVMKRREK